MTERTGLQVIEVDIDTDDALVRDWGLRVPVVLAEDGRVVAEGPMDDERVLQRLIEQMTDR
jgi:hypothetical protein